MPKRKEGWAQWGNEKSKYHFFGWEMYDVYFSACQAFATGRDNLDFMDKPSENKRCKNCLKVRGSASTLKSEEG